MRISPAAVLIVLALTGCVAGGAPPERPSPSGAAHGGGDIAGEWDLTRAEDAAGDLDVSIAPITIAVHSDGSVTGEGPCNHFEGETRPEGAAAPSGAGSGQWFTVLIWGGAACADPAAGDLERRYLAALAAVTDTRADDRALTLTGPDATLRFSPSDE